MSDPFSRNLHVRFCKHLHCFYRLKKVAGGDSVDMVLLSCVHLLPSHFAKDHSINKRIC